MSVIISVDHETGDLTGYTLTVEDLGDLSVAAVAALAGSNYGLSCVVDDTVAIYGAKTIANNTSGIVRARFYIDPNGIVLGGQIIYPLRVSGTNVIGYVRLSHSTDYGIAVNLADDAGVYTFGSTYAIADGPHFVEVQWTRAANSTSADGQVQLWIDGVYKGAVTGIDNYDRFANFNTARLGATYVSGAMTGGTFFLDQLVVNDDGGEIGPYSKYTLACDSGSFTLTGQAASLLFGRRISASNGSFALSGQVVGLLRGFRLSAANGGYALSGQALGLTAARVIGFGAGLHALTGEVVGLLRGYRIADTAGSYALAGQDVTLTYTPKGGGYTLVCGAGIFALSGQSAGLLATRKLAMGRASYTLTGEAASPKYGRVIIVAAGAFALTGKTVAFRMTRVIGPAAGLFALTGQNVDIWIATPTPDERIYAIDAETRVYVVAAETRAYAVAVESRVLMIE